jgi:hypothetical protein
MAYDSGRERRRRFVYETRNSEYHVFDHICVAIRDKQSGDWVRAHNALRKRIEGGVRVFSNGAAIPTLRAPEVGTPMYFHIDKSCSEQVITSRLIAVNRPEKHDLARYPSAKAG